MHAMDIIVNGNYYNYYPISSFSILIAFTVYVLFYKLTLTKIKKILPFKILIFYLNAMRNIYA